ncbi:MAG: HEPN domain-containing protein [Caldilineaceae bacterium SB0665_bin_21]|nr:HEPN domain-containing protein [Caldilineaceae bacterium SB0665_bin_21]MYA03072.1 HEPN domain-containing protein [Caldilineaceae bacterium SB0664_bin_22]MYC63214.1 HEPN domain-containing protein [Caldilineaceae bacterium SB0661_bin_34]
MAAVERPLQTSDTAEAESGLGQPDPRALAVARALQDQLPDTQQVVLFGSRATGIWKPHSDIDLAVLGAPSDLQTVGEMGELARIEADAVYSPSPSIQITPLSWPEFEEGRSSYPHVAGQVQLWGLTTTGDHLSPMPQGSPWPGVQRLLQVSQRHLEAALAHTGDNRMHFSLFHALSAMETAVKASLGAHRICFDHHHDLNGFVADLPDDLQLWMDSKISHSQRKALVDFRNPSLYDRIAERWTLDPPEEIVATAQQVCGELAKHVLGCLGKTPRDVKYDYWLSDGSLGGLESVPALGYRSLLTEPEQMAIGALHVMLGDVLPLADLSRIECAWRQRGIPDDVAARIGAVMAKPAAWRTLLPDELDDGSETDQPPAQ